MDKCAGRWRCGFCENIRCVCKVIWRKVVTCKYVEAIAGSGFAEYIVLSNSVLFTEARNRDDSVYKAEARCFSDSVHPAAARHPAEARYGNDSVHPAGAGHLAEARDWSDSVHPAAAGHLAEARYDAPPLDQKRAVARVAEPEPKFRDLRKLLNRCKTMIFCATFNCSTGSDGRDVEV